MAAPVIQTAFSQGEITPSLFGHVDLAKFHSAAATMRNLFVDFRGGARSRAGTKYVGRSKQRPDLGDPKPRLIGYQFSLPQGEVLEFGEQYIRFIVDGGYVVEASKAISSATQANPCAIGCVANGFANGDWVAIDGVVGMTELNGNTYIVAGAATNSFTLEDLDGNPVDATGYTAYISGGTASRIYTIASPYAAADLAKVKFTQSADVMSLTHPNYPPQELSRLGATNWTIAAASFDEPIGPPAAIQALATVNPSGATTPPTLPAAFAYVVTAVDPATGRESIASPIGNVTDSVDIAQTAGSIIIGWSPVAGAQYYNIYKAPTSYNTDPGSSTNALPVPAGAIFGAIASTFGTQYVDSNDPPDFAHSPPTAKNPFAPSPIIGIDVTASSGDWTTATVAITTSTGAGFIGQVVISAGAIAAVIVLNAGHDYDPSDVAVFTGDGSSVSSTVTVGPATGTDPSLVAYFQERRVYAATLNQPDTYFMSQPGAFLDFDSTIPVNDADAITGTPWSEQVNGLQWMVSMPSGLVTFTGSGVWQLGAAGSFGLSSPAAITPANQIAVPQSSIGASSTVPPIRVNWDILYLQAKGYTIRDLTYQIYFNIYTGTDISWQSSHLLIGYELMEWAWCEEPYRVLWGVRDDGILLSLTYLKEQEIQGLSRQTTQGQVRSVCTVTELPVDALYWVAERTVVAGGTRYFIERMDNRIWAGIEDVWCVDAAVSLPLETPAAMLFASAPSGSGVSFVAAAPIWNGDSVGKIIRSGGGIAKITASPTTTTAVGTWYYPCQQVTPDDPFNVPLPQLPGTWTLGTPVTSVGGLGHLVGRNVTGIADGVPLDPILVPPNGRITLPFPASKVVVGLGFTAQLQSVYLDAGTPTVQGRRKAIPAVTARVEASAVPQTGVNQVDASTLSPPALVSTWTLPPAVPLPPGAPQPYTTPGGGTAMPLYTGDLRAITPTAWQKPGQVAVQQTKPVPLNILALIPEALPGDMPEVELSQRPAARRA